jgi:hypothetical protein
LREIVIAHSVDEMLAQIERRHIPLKGSIAPPLHLWPSFKDHESKCHRRVVGERQV